MNKEDIYSLLGINSKTSAEVVKKAFREFARSHHPDFFPDDKNREERFKRVTSAYQNWKLLQKTVGEIARIGGAYHADRHDSGFKPWGFSCRA